MEARRTYRKLDRSPLTAEEQAVWERHDHLRRKLTAEFARRYRQVPAEVVHDCGTDAMFRVVRLRDRRPDLAFGLRLRRQIASNLMDVMRVHRGRHTRRAVKLDWQPEFAFVPALASPPDGVVAAAASAELVAAVRAVVARMPAAQRAVFGRMADDGEFMPGESRVARAAIWRGKALLAELLGDRVKSFATGDKP